MATTLTALRLETAATKVDDLDTAAARGLEQDVLVGEKKRGEHPIKMRKSENDLGYLWL